MRTDIEFTGRCAMTTEATTEVRRPWLGPALAALTLLLPAVAAGQSAPQPPVEAQAAQRAAATATAVFSRAGQDGLHARLLRGVAASVRRLDPAVFIEISPVSASEPALLLPEDQREAP